jgi:regulator of protease activity HflC (stomatin/prohibitin superfamily)
VQVHVDGVLYMKVMNPERASYGVTDYLFAISQLAQTTLRSEIGKIDLDRTFEERMHINAQLVTSSTRRPSRGASRCSATRSRTSRRPQDVLAAMEKQMRAEREKRAVILTSEGQRDAAINNAEGEKQQVIKASRRRSSSRSTRPRGRRRRSSPWPKRRRKASGRSPRRSTCPAASRRLQLRVAEQYIGQFGQLAKESNTLVLPANAADVGSMIALAMNVIGRRQAGAAS